MSSGPAAAPRSARSSSLSNPAAMPSKRRRASSGCNLSRILVSLEIEEVTGRPLQDQRLQALKIEEAEAQGLLDGGKEGARGIGPLQLEQTAQRPHAPTVGALLEGRGVALEARMVPAPQLLLERGPAGCSRWRGMMTRQRGACIALADEPPMAADLATSMIDDDLGGVLVHTHRLPDQPLRYRVAVGVDRNVAVEIDDALEDLVNWWQDARQGLKVWLLQHISRLGRRTEDAVRFLVGDLPTPRQRLAVQIDEVDEGAPREEVPFYPKEGSLDSPFAIGMAEMMSPKGEAQCARKGRHFRRDHRLRSRARHHHHAGVVDDAKRAAAVVEPDCL